MSSIRQAILSDPDVAVKLTMIVPRDYVGEVTELMVKRGVLEPVALEPGSPEFKEIKSYFTLLDKAKEVYQYLESNLAEKTVVRIEVPQDSLRAVLESLTNNLEEVCKRVKNINELISLRNTELEELEAVKKIAEVLLSKYPDGKVSLLNYSGKLIVIKSVVATEGSYEVLREKSVAILGEVQHGKKIVASLAFAPGVLEDIVRTSGLDVRVLDVREPSEERLDTFVARLEEKIAEIRKTLEELDSKKREVLKFVTKDIALLKSLVESEYERLKILRSAISSKYVAVVSGWVLRSKVNDLLKSLSSYPIYASIVPDENPPVEFKNLEPFKPFELLTELYGMPSPHEWDPTPLLTYSFLLFFSLMMSDAGYGLGVILATRYILPKFVSDPESPGFVRLKKILYIGGVLSVVAGIASKSFLGSLVGRFIPIEKPLINTFNIMELIGLSLIIGFAFTFVSHLIALAKNIKLRKNYDSIYEVGILVLMIGGLFVVTRVFNLGWTYVADELYTVAQSLTIVGIAMVIFAKIKTTGSVGSFLWLFDVVGIVGDVFSYVRIAGIAGGTAFLAEAFNSILSGVVGSIIEFNYVIGVVAGVFLVLIIHTLNLALSAVSPFVHSLRLCLFEISSKFFEAQGRRIKPVKVVVGKVTI
ncbi:MAG: V-type ATPase 116kDa subunit family protein [Sulfolobales archaeon]